MSTTPESQNQQIQKNLRHEGDRDDRDENIYNRETVLSGYDNLIDINRSVNKYMVDKILSKIKNIENVGYFRILDIGCGLSPLLPILLKRLRGEKPEVVVSYTGVDSSREMISLANEKYSPLNDTDTEINYISADAQSLYALDEFSWFNIVIVQNYIHLILDDTHLNNVLKFVSKVLANNGVFYISTKTTVDTVSHIRDDVYLVRKNLDSSSLYERRVFTDESFDEKVVKVFDRENTYRMDVFRESDNTGSEFLNAIGYKDTYMVYKNYRYSLGFDQRLKNLRDLLKDCKDVKEYVDDVSTMNTVRKEGCLMDIFRTRHGVYLQIMGILKDILQDIVPGSSPIYMKDKLNMNQVGWRFHLHQDASAGWRTKMQARLPGTTFVTFGIPLSRITESTQGPTRIAIRQGLCSKVVPETKEDFTVDEESINARLGKKLQYLTCYGVEGSYYVFDQFVLHDSSFNLKQQSREVLFITVAISHRKDEPLFDSMEIAELFYKTKSVLDKKSIQDYLEKGYTAEDFAKDTFGKITLKSKDS
ncbi:class I SAM-dependent methyltransferase [Yasminevirus sp. GU-2018]|uniref:Class I SAM-dependent methyltransferase n=1 Tax=Yasminevirus sp. GU-2018 TaxID=2420051 RepID=A0A5K0UC94_9VIRU|nr:class I SAM-dependent methyltransferase [Yasminevirus sp. GU-2018]